MDKLLEEIKQTGGLPLIVVYGIPDESGVNLNWFSTSKYDEADDTLKADVKKAVGMIYEQLKNV